MAPRHRRRRAAALGLVCGVVVAACTDGEAQAPTTTWTPVETVAPRPVELPEVVDPEPLPPPAPPQVVEPETDPTTLFVSPLLGDDANDGQTPDQPWASLATALTRVEPGSTLHLMTGVYDEVSEPRAAHYVIDTDGTVDDPIRITAAPGAQPVIVATEGNAIEVRADHVEVSGLEVQGRGFDQENAYGWGIFVHDAHHVAVTGNRISAMAVGGITSIRSSNLAIVDNEVFDNAFWGSEQGSGISLWRSEDHGLGPDEEGYHDRIVGNRVYRNENKVYSRWHTDRPTIANGNGIIIDTSDGTGYPGRVLVANNVVFDNGGRAVLVLDASQVDIVHNTTFRNGRTADLDGGRAEIAARRAREVRVLNNLVWALPGVPAVTVGESTLVELGGNVLVTDAGPGPASALDLVVDGDPGLRNPSVDPSTADLRPLAYSIARGRALATNPSVTSDVDGRDRPFDGATAGAYEWVE
ncbi:MAG: right-handed parallel beta-helix repeat-containing protein [Actinomycetota bacterium]